MPKITLRLTDEQHAALVAAAERNHRSVQGEIVHRVFAAELRDEGWARVGPGAKDIDVTPDPKPAKAEKGRR